jgi:hypothetical protein
LALGHPPGHDFRRGFQPQAGERHTSLVGDALYGAAAFRFGENGVGEYRQPSPQGGQRFFVQGLECAFGHFGQPDDFVLRAGLGTGLGAAIAGRRGQ